MVIGTLAIGQTIIILTAGIDLSCGVVMAFGSIVMTKMAVNNGVPALLAVLLGIIACLAFGVINGGFVTFLGLPPFIVTLGTYNIAFALTHIYSKDETISGLPTLMTKLGEGFSVGSTRITYGSVLCLALFIATWFALSQSAWGRHVYTLGDNPEAARLMGIPVRRKLLMVYVIAAGFYGIAALLLIARTNVGDPNAGVTENLESITAVVLGGTSLFGGRGTVIGTLIGAIIIGVLRNGLVLMGVASIYQVLITGILVILAVSVDQLARRRAKGAPRRAESPSPRPAGSPGPAARSPRSTARTSPATRARSSRSSATRARASRASSRRSPEPSSPTRARS